MCSSDDVESLNNARVRHSETAQRHEDSDDEPMVYETPKDYATSARQRREQLIAQGVDPHRVVLQSNLYNDILRREDESPADFAKRRAAIVKSMIVRGIIILNDQCTTEVVASKFKTADGRFFDLGPGSGATKGEFREFSHWLSKAGQADEVPEKWLRFEREANNKQEDLECKGEEHLHFS